MDDKELRALAEAAQRELEAREEERHGKGFRATVRRYVHTETLRVAHEIGLATFGVIAADHYIVPLIVHIVPMVAA